ncbi:MAG: Lipid II flippase MurJ [Phycisphaerae bacterium]|nr:Lipid II flippase MurJ [Phycisphaerae bacterium]
MSESRHVISSARLIGVATLLSRITGMVRDMVLASWFGATWVADNYNFAFQVPNLFRRLFAEGAMSAVFVPVFSGTLEQEGRESGWRLLARTLALLVTTLVAILIVAELAVVALWFAFPGDDPTVAADRRLLVALTALMLPFMLFISVVALLSSILNCVGCFGPPALMPLVFNLVTLGGIWFIGPLLSRTDPTVQIFGVAASVVLAGVIEVLALWPVMRRHGVPWRWQFDLKDAKVRVMMRRMGPVILGQGVLMIGVFLDTAIAKGLTHPPNTAERFALLGWSLPFPLEEGAITVLTVAQRLYQFPLGVLAISLAVAVLPTLSRIAARKDWVAWTGEMRSSLRLAIFAGLLAGVMMLLLSEPIVRLLFEYRKFTAADTPRAARALACYGIGMWAFCALHIVLRGFYSIADVRTPLKISCVLLPLNLLISLLVVWLPALREAGFGLSTSLTASINVVVGLTILQNRSRVTIFDRRMLAALGRMLAAGAISAGCVLVARPLILSSSASSALLRAVDVFGSLTVGVAGYLAAAWVLRLPEARLIFQRRRRAEPACAHAA